MITIDFNALAAFITSLGIIGGAVFAVLKWFGRQKKTAESVGELSEKEKTDVAEIKRMHNEDMQKMSNELCVVSYGLLAALDGLKQLGCNGEVTKAHDKLSKHLNLQAHDKV